MPSMRPNNYPFVAQRVPTNCHPTVRKLFELMNVHRVSQGQLGRKSGLNPWIFGNWKRRSNPSLTSIEAALGAMGYQLVVAPIASAPQANPEAATGTSHPSQNRLS